MGNIPSHFNAAFIEAIFENYQSDPESVEPSWRYFFDGMAFANSGPFTSKRQDEDFRIFALIRAYRKWGHHIAKLNPIFSETKSNPALALEKFGFSEEDLDRLVPSGGLLERSHVPLSELLNLLQDTYCGYIGVEFLHGEDPDIETWFQDQLEPQRNQPELSLEEKKWVLQKLNDAELFETFLQKKYVGQKRFSLEGAESLIPCLAEIIESLSGMGGEEVVMGMSHRGRLNVLANIMGKTFQELFAEFEPNYLPDSVQGGGDVKYHKGFESTYKTRSKRKVELSLADNPSHLEAVCPVVEGLVRAHQTLRHDENRSQIVPVLIHGDASFAGQGMVSETLNMSQLNGFGTGGTIHIIVNNQIGFTTNPQDARSTLYASDVARQILAPVFHVNGDHPEAVVHVARLASAFRQTFHRDVVIDLICYRRHGHNEGDEPSFTQPMMYEKIRKHLSPRRAYCEQLVQQGSFEAQVAKDMESKFQNALEEALAKARSGSHKSDDSNKGIHFQSHRFIDEAIMLEPVDTAVPAERLNHLIQTWSKIPEDFSLNRKIKRVFDARLKQVSTGTGLNWGCAEHLAIASLLDQGIPCRLTGQDVQRGTFSHRHAVVFDAKTGEPFTPLSQVVKEDARFSIYNSHLSEQAVLGFEFGYGLAQPRSLVIWEAQFGDFCNGAQTIIDQFIASSEAKWHRVSNLVMFLPHGYEGQGPEHSSARLERFLQLCAQANMQVANLTQPAQLFHILRRQMLREFRKPLVLMTPKSLLRHAECVSPLSQFSNDRFHEVLPDTLDGQGVTRLVFCSGKIYFDLLAARRERNDNQVGIVRIEQLYPLAIDQIASLMGQYPSVKQIVWAQEEPKNMGAWGFIHPHLEALFDCKIQYAGRVASASPAAGSLSLHTKEQESIMEQVFDHGRLVMPARGA